MNLSHPNTWWWKWQVLIILTSFRVRKLEMSRAFFLCKPRKTLEMMQCKKEFWSDRNCLESSFCFFEGKRPIWWWWRRLIYRSAYMPHACLSFLPSSPWLPFQIELCPLLCWCNISNLMCKCVSMSRSWNGPFFILLFFNVLTVCLHQYTIRRRRGCFVACMQS